MPAPRYVNQLQENAVWLSLAALWSIGGMTAWLVAISYPATSGVGTATSSGLALLAAVTTTMSLVVRLPILSSPPHTSLTCDHAVWLLSTFASVNWLGFFVLQCPQWPDALPAVMVLLTGEIWFHVTAWKQGALPWLRESLTRLALRIGNLGLDRPPQLDRNPSGEVPAWSAIAIPSVGENCGQVAQERLSEHIQRRQVQGVDEQGRRFLSGEIRVALAVDQPSETIIVAFSPPFLGAPEVDFDCEAEQVEVKLVNCTPTGMRLEIRRFSSAEPLVFSLPWYAAEVELGNLSAAASLPRRLP